MASDHHIADAAAFRAAVSGAIGTAERGHIVAFGVKPAWPATDFGYIAPGDALGAGMAARRVKAFIEKPDAQEARALIAAAICGTACIFFASIASWMRSPSTRLRWARRLAGRWSPDRWPAISCGSVLSSAPCQSNRSMSR